MAVVPGLGWEITIAGGEGGNQLTEWLHGTCMWGAQWNRGWLQTNAKGMPNQVRFEAGHRAAGDSHWGKKEALTTGRCTANTDRAMQEASRVRSMIIQ